MTTTMANMRLGQFVVGLLLALGLCACCGARTPGTPLDVVAEPDEETLDLPRPDLVDAVPVDVPLRDVEIPPACFGKWADLSALADAQYPGGSRWCGKFSQPDESLGVCVNQMVEVPEGPFLRGCLRPLGRGCYGIPLHEVVMPRFWIDRTEVTAGQYAECVESGTCTVLQCSHNSDDHTFPLDSLDSQPARCSTWSQADQYCRWVGKRLCTDAEWDKAFHGTDGRLFPWGDYPASCGDMLPAIRLAEDVYCPPEMYNCPLEVGSSWFDVSPYGVLDLGGSVAEWVNDWVGHKYWAVDGFSDKSEAVYDPWGPRQGESHVVRGRFTGYFTCGTPWAPGCCFWWCKDDDPPYTASRVAFDQEDMWLIEWALDRIGIRCCSRDWGKP